MYSDGEIGSVCTHYNECSCTNGIPFTGAECTHTLSLEDEACASCNVGVGAGEERGYFVNGLSCSQCPAGQFQPRGGRAPYEADHQCRYISETGGYAGVFAGNLGTYSCNPCIPALPTGEQVAGPSFDASFCASGVATTTTTIPVCT